MRRFFFILAFVLAFGLFSCRTEQKTITVWTDKAEMASYIELFNVESHDVKAVIVYKDALATSLPPAKDEKRPDIIIGSLLQNSLTKKNFITLDSILGEKNKKGELKKNRLDKDGFYNSLLDYGKFNSRQYLLPVSFNLPIMIFSNENKDAISDKYTLELEEIKEISAKFNAKNKNGMYSKMGFAPSWNANFIYTAVKMNGADFRETLNSIVWNDSALEMEIEYMKDWTKKTNTSTTAEQDFSFKYLYTPSYKQISSGRCLFSYSTTDEFFSLAPEQIQDTDFRWLTKEEMIFAEDDITTAGIYRKSRRKSESKEFLLWLLNSENQKRLLDRSQTMNLGTKTFGICNGFSAVKTVNERYFPTYYKNLIGNLPGESSIQSPFALPPRWNSLKNRVIIPYISEATRTEEGKKIQTIEERLNTWSKQFN